MRIFDRVYIKFFGMPKYLRKKGVDVGEECHIYSDISTTESYLIKLHNNITISNGVQFITHDNAICKVSQYSDLFGEIEIGNNCFIGAKSIIMYGVKIPNNTIIAAGSVVTKSVAEEGLILGGNPAKKIGVISQLAEKAKIYGVSLDGLTRKEKIYVTKNAKKVQR